MIKRKLYKKIQQSAVQEVEVQRKDERKIKKEEIQTVRAAEVPLRVNQEIKEITNEGKEMIQVQVKAAEALVADLQAAILRILDQTRVLLDQDLNFGSKRQKT